RNLVLLSCFDQAPVKRHQLRVPVKSCRQRSSVKRMAQSLTAALDVTHPDVIAAIVIIGSKASKRGDLLPRDASELRQAYQYADCGLQSDAIDAVEQIKPLGQVAMLANGDNKALKLGFLELFEAGDLCLPDLADARITAGFATVLDRSDVGNDLLNHREMLGER